MVKTLQRGGIRATRKAAWLAAPEITVALLLSTWFFVRLLPSLRGNTYHVSKNSLLRLFSGSEKWRAKKWRSVLSHVSVCGWGVCVWKSLR